jgi:hypothetical protein
MLILLGLLNLGSFRRRLNHAHEHSHVQGLYLRLRPAIVGVVHGLAGSAAVALLVLPMIRNPYLATFYLLIFGAGTIVGMVLITAMIAAPITYSANHFRLFNRYAGTAAGALSAAFGLFLIHQIGFSEGLFR